MEPHARTRLEWRTLLLLLALALGLYLTVDLIQGGRTLRPPSLSNDEGAYTDPSSSSSSFSTPRKNEDVSAISSTETRTSTTTTTVVDPKTGVETETTTTTTTVVTTVVAKHHRPQLPPGRFHTLLNPHSADAPTFDWSAPLLPLLPPDQAKRFLKEDKGTEWLPADVRAMVKPREKPVRVVVVFPLDCEIDLLEVRLMETYDVVDYFVIGESNYSQVGGAKRLHFWESRHRFERFWPKIRHMAFWEGFKDATRIKKHDWNNEDQERGLLGQGLRGLDDDDIILLTDADEIANADALNFYRHFTGYPPGGRIFVRWSQMGFFWKVPAVWTPQACMTTYAIAKQIGTSGIRKAKFKLEHGRDWWILGSASVVAGWHCSWCFPPQDYMNKFRNVIEAWWFHADELKDFTPEVFANARYKGTKPIAADIVVQDHEGIPAAAKEHFKYLSDRDVFPKCGWCLMPKDPTSHPVGSIKPEDPLPEDMLKQSQECSNDVTLAFTPYR